MHSPVPSVPFLPISFKTTSFILSTSQQKLKCFEMFTSIVSRKSEDILQSKWLDSLDTLLCIYVGMITYYVYYMNFSRDTMLRIDVFLLQL